MVACIHTMDLYLQDLSDTTLAVQNMYLAAESLGLGGVILGSIRNDIRAVSELFNLPDMVIPALGLQIGIPDEEIQQICKGYINEFGAQQFVAPVFYG